MKKMVLTIEVPDDFEKGCCYMCPLMDEWCLLGDRYDECQLREDKEMRFVPWRCDEDEGLRAHVDSKREWFKGVFENE